MKRLEGRIEKLEQLQGSDRQEIVELLDNQNLDIFERIRILYDAGIFSGEMIARWIKQGGKNDG